METNADQLSELMQRYARGEDGVFEQLYRLMAPRLHRFCWRLATRQSEADDYFQETLLRIHRARATYLASSNTLHWAFAISRSVYLDRLRYRRRRPEALGSAHDAADQPQLRADDRYSPEAAIRARDVQEVLTRELSRMSEKNRVAYVLLKEEGLTKGGGARGEGGGGGAGSAGGGGAATRSWSVHPPRARAERGGMGRVRR